MNGERSANGIIGGRHENGANGVNALQRTGGADIRARAACAIGAAWAMIAASAAADVVLENRHVRLAVGDDAVVKSLVVKAGGEELVAAGECMPLFSVTQERFFNNEIKLAHPTMETTCRACSVRREGDELTIGFELVPYKAKVRVNVADDYICFELAGFTYGLKDYQLGPQFPVPLDMKLPPVKSFRLLQLPLAGRSRFGEWLNVSWDERSAAAVVAAEPYTRIRNERRNGFRILSADAERGLRLEGARAVLVASAKADFLACLDRMERDFGLPCGVAARKSDLFNSSVYWTADITPENADRHIALARRGGFRMMLVYHTAVCDAPGDYAGIGGYAVSRAFGGDAKNVVGLLEKAKAAGMKVGLHVLHPFIGLDSSYISPVADHRLNLKRHFTLKRPLGTGAEDVYVEQNPAGAPENSKSRVLQFGGELITYSGFTTERPYRFTGIGRGYRKTRVVAHPAGQIGGLLDICEFGGEACYADQETDLQDELADKIAAIYNLGFDFLCMDGCEGVNAPYEIHVANAQYRVWKKLVPRPLFTEGAAKAHFAWHHLSGANAFDVFVPDEFKAMIVRWPLHEAEELAQDFSRVSFGWWGLWLPGERLNDGTATVGTHPDMWEFGTSRAAAWDSPTTIQFTLEKAERHPRIADLMEVMRRWEDVRAGKWLTPSQKEALKSPTQEHHLYVNEKGEYELHEIEMLPSPENARNVRAFLFERAGRRVVAYWHASGACRLAVSLDGKGADGMFPADGIRYIATPLSRNAVRHAWTMARELD